MDRPVTFGEFELRVRQRQLLRGRGEVQLTKVAFDVLAHLVSHHGELVSKDALIRAVWNGGTASDAALTKRVQEIRAALGDDPRAPRFIKTVARRGFRFVGEVALARLRQSPPPWFVGRERERRQLATALQHAEHGARQVLFVTGPSGVGKSALVETFLADVALPFLIGIGSCIDSSDGRDQFVEAFLPLQEAVTAAAREPRGGALLAALRRCAPSWLANLPALVDERESQAFARRSIAITLPRLMRELTDACESCAAEQPLLLVLEDLQWSDLATRTWIEHLARQRRSSRLCVVATWRTSEERPLPAEAADLLHGGHALEVQLERLTRADVASYVARRFGPGATEPRAAEQTVWARSNGLPLLMRIAADELIDATENLPGDPLQPSSHTDGDARAATASVAAHLRKRLTAATQLQQRILRVAAAYAKPFTSEFVAATLGAQTQRVEDECVDLVRVGLIWPAEREGYALTHDLVRAAIGETMSAGERADVHRALADRLEARGAAPSEIASHLERAGLPARSIAYFVAAGMLDLRRGTQTAAEANLSRAATLFDATQASDDDLGLQLFNGLGMAHGVLRGLVHPLTAAAYSRALQHAHEGSATAGLFPSLYGLCCHYLLRADIAQAAGYADRVACLAAERGDPTIHAWGAILQGQVAHFTGELSKARTLFETAMAYRLPESDPHLAHTWTSPDVLAACYAAPLYTDIGCPDSALRCCDRAIALAEQLESPYALAFAHYTSSKVRATRLENEIASTHAERSLALARENQYGAIEAWAEAQACSLRSGEEALRRLLEVLDTLDAQGVRLGTPAGYLVAAGRLAADNRVDEALPVLERGETIARQTNEQIQIVSLMFERGAVLARAPQRRDEAIRHFVSAARAARALGALGWEMRSTIGLATAVRDDPVQFRRVVADVARLHDSYTEGSDTVGLRLARSYCQWAGVAVASPV